jgi:hypothetical protein
MLYWAEGTKTRNAVRFPNSDPELVRFFVAFLKTKYSQKKRKNRLPYGRVASS